jgi:biotin carboxyl carrier protein
MSPREPLRVAIGDLTWDFEAPDEGGGLRRSGYGAGTLESAGGRRALTWQALSGSGPSSSDGSGDAAFEIVVDGWRFEAMVGPLVRAQLRERARRDAASAAAHGPLLVRAPIPGRIGAVRVHQGEAVEAGAALLTLEAMKMENVVRAPRAGTIGRITAAAGQTVELGDPLLELA